MIDRWMLLTLMGAGAFMFWGAGHYTVFDDEAFSCRRYAMPPGEMLAALYHNIEPDPPLYYLLQNGWVHLFGMGQVVMRSLPILLFLAGLIFVRLAGEAWYDRRTGIVAMVLAAFHPAHLFLGLAARWYSAMFLAVAVLLWLTGRLTATPRPTGRQIAAWALAAAAACYTNYYGPLVVVLMAIAGALRSPGGPRRYARWVFGVGAGFALFAPWLEPFWAELSRAPQFGHTYREFGATGVRCLVMLVAGNLASADAWWALGPLIFFCIGLLALGIFDRRRAAPIALIPIACLAAGLASRTMIDKYIMIFSGPTCVLAGGLLSSSPGQVGLRRNTLHNATRIALIVGWLGCAANLVTERHWTSLRWLDPFEQAMNDLSHNAASIPVTNCVVTHPSARYYYACTKGSGSWVGADIWRHYAAPPVPDEVPREITPSQTARPDVPAKPETILPRVRAGEVRELVTVESAGFADDPFWIELRSILATKYHLRQEWKYLEDPNAALKDRLDTRFRHPQWRIEVKWWERRQSR